METQSVQVLEEKVERQPEQLAQRLCAWASPGLNISSTEQQVSGKLFAQAVAQWSRLTSQTSFQCSPYAWQSYTSYPSTLRPVPGTGTMYWQMKND